VFDLLAVLIRERRRVVPKEELLDTVWGNRFVSESALTRRVKAARQAADVEHKGLFAPGGIRHPHLLGPNQRGPGPVNLQIPLDHHCAAQCLTRLPHHIVFEPAPIKDRQMNQLGPNQRGPGRVSV